MFSVQAWGITAAAGVVVVLGEAERSDQPAEPTGAPDVVPGQVHGLTTQKAGTIRSTRFSA